MKEKNKFHFGLIVKILFVLFLIFLGLYLVGLASNAFYSFDCMIHGQESKPPPTDIINCLKGVFVWKYSSVAFVVLGIIVAVIAGFIFYLRRPDKNFDDRNFRISENGTYGTSKYLQESEAKKLLTADGKNNLLKVEKEVGNEKGIILGKYPNGDIVFKNVIPKENLNFFAIGSPGSGKSYMMVRPYLAQAIRRGESIICTDPSGELLETIGGYARQQGYEVRVFNLVNPSRSDSWNLTKEVGADQTLAQICTQTIIDNTTNGKSDAFYDNGEKNLLKALLLYMNSPQYTTNDKSIGELYKMLTGDNFKGTLETINQLSEDHPAKIPYNIFAAAPNNVQESFHSGLAIRLQILQSPAIRDMLSGVGNPMELTAPAKRKCAYFIAMSDQDSTFQLASSLFFSFLFIDLAAFGKTQPNQDLPVHINVVLDELPSIGQIPDLGRKMATVRKYGVNVFPIVQMVSQLDNRYSEAERDEIIGCCDTQIWLGSNDITSAQMLVDRAGTMTINSSTKSHSLTESKGQISNTDGKRALLNLDEFLRLPLDEAIVVLRGQNIMKLKKFKFFEHPDAEAVENAPKMSLDTYEPSRYASGADNWIDENKTQQASAEPNVPRDNTPTNTKPQQSNPTNYNAGEVPPKSKPKAKPKTKPKTEPKPTSEPLTRNNNDGKRGKQKGLGLR